jgi:fermentation-respiration switch protein FrsA (DUF1100 family)
MQPPGCILSQRRSKRNLLVALLNLGITIRQAANTACPVASFALEKALPNSRTYFLRPAQLFSLFPMDSPNASGKTCLGRLLNFLLTILIGYLLVLVLVRLGEARLIFFPNYPDRLDGDWHPRSLPVEDIWLTTSDGVKLHAWWIPRDNAKFTFLAFHGNASNIANRAPIYEFLRDSPANVFALEYRGYGHSEGKPSESGIYRDAQAAYDYLVNTKGIDRKTIISFGQSLGTAVAANLAAHRQVAAVVLEAPFPSASRMARRVFWFLPGASLVVYGQFDTQSRLKEIHAPLLIVHCNQDPVIPFEFGQQVYDSALPPKTFVQINGSCHEESSLIAPTQYRTALHQFLSSL